MFFGESHELVSDPAVLATGTVTKKFVRFEWIIFKKLGYELLKLLLIFFVSELAAKLPHLLSPGDIRLWRLPLADAVQVWFNSRSARKFPADGSQGPSVEEYVGNRQDGGNGCQCLLDFARQISALTQIAQCFRACISAARG